MLRAVALVLALCAPATANPFEVVGLTSRRAAQANTGAASADDASALYYNPAGLTEHPALELTAGLVGAYEHLRESKKLPDPFGAQLAMRAPLPLRGALANRIVVGLALHLLPGDLARVRAPSPDEAFYPYYGDRLSRIVVLPGAAARLGKLALGVSVDVLAGLGGSIEASEGATRAIDARVDERIETRTSVIAGASYQLTPCFRIGAVFRQRFELPFATRAQTIVAGEQLDLDLEAAGQFTPHQLVLGAAWSRHGMTIAVDGRYARWSDYRGPYVRVDSTLPLVGDVPALSPAVPFGDTFGARASIEARVRAFTLRGGYGFETSPVPETQTGVTNLLDGPRHTVAFGIGRAFGGIRIDAHVQLQLVGSRTLDKEPFDNNGVFDPFTSIRDEDLETSGFQTSNPGFPDALTGGGQVVSGGITIGVGL